MSCCCCENKLANEMSRERDYKSTKQQMIYETFYHQLHFYINKSDEDWLKLKKQMKEHMERLKEIKDKGTLSDIKDSERYGIRI